MNMFLQRQNDTLKYVEKTVKQIGYAIWNKAIIFSKKTSSGRGSSIGDSTDIIYIPFVRENQNYVNASMIVHASPTDTNFNYICDWEYSQRQYGLNNADSSAEHTAAFFMLLDKEVFGHTEFEITDADLFADHPMDSQSLRRTVYLNDSTSTHGRASNYTITECYGFIVCGSPNSAYCAHGCDYLNCISEPDVCYYTELCFDWEYIEGTGGGGTGSSGGTGGGGGGATGGGTGRGTPSECDPGPTNGNRTEIHNNCGPGWMPGPIDDDPPISPNHIIIDSLQGYPCAQGILAALPNLNAETKNILQNTFGINESFNIIFRADTNMPNYDNGVTSRIAKNVATNTFDIGIRLNGNMLRNSSKEFILNVMFHESIHAYINYQWFLYNTNQIDSVTFKTEFPVIWNYKNGNNAQHIEISESYISKLKQTISNYNVSADSLMVRAIAWVGLQETPAWINLANDTIDIREKALIAKYGTLAQMISYGLKKCN